MAEPPEKGPDRRVTSLIAGIVRDARDHVYQHLSLLKLEMHDKSEQAQECLRALCVGRELALVGGLCVVFTLVSALHELAPALPLSVCFGVVGLPLLLAGPPSCVRDTKS
jgi:hypothetical protein